MTGAKKNMNYGWRLVAGVPAIAMVVFAENLFGQQLNAMFLRLPGLDKVLHVLQYLFVFAAVYLLAPRTFLRPRRVLIAGVFGALLSIADELLQQLAPGRNLELFDLLADCSGLTLGWVIVAKPIRALALTAGTLAVGLAAYVTYDTHVRLIDYSRALGYERQHDFVRAREYYLRALERGMRTSELYNELGWVEIESGRGDPRKAVEYARTALAMQPGNADILDTYGWALHHAGRSLEALEPLKKAYAAKPTMFCIHYHLGSAYLALGQRDLAEAHFRQQVKLSGTREAVMAARTLETMASQP